MMIIYCIQFINRISVPFHNIPNTHNRCILCVLMSSPGPEKKNFFCFLLSNLICTCWTREWIQMVTYTHTHKKNQSCYRSGHIEWPVSFLCVWIDVVKKLKKCFQRTKKKIFFTFQRDRFQKKKNWKLFNLHTHMDRRCGFSFFKFNFYFLCVLFRENNNTPEWQWNKRKKNKIFFFTIYEIKYLNYLNKCSRFFFSLLLLLLLNDLHWLLVKKITTRSWTI